MASLIPSFFAHAAASSSSGSSSSAAAPPAPLSPAAPPPPAASASSSSAAAPRMPAMSAPSLSSRSEQASSSRLPPVADDALAQDSSAGAASSSSRPAPALLRTAVSDASLASSSAPPSPAGLSSADARRQPTPAAVQPAAEQEAARRSRRVMPARLMRVSSLLAGSAVEDELLGGIEGKIESPFLPAGTSIFLSSEQPKLAYEASAPGEAAFSFFSDPEIARSCRMREQIETPDFKPWDDSEMLGKTRALKSTEDMSDAAYEKRHRRPDKLEKRQRRLEKERLIKDRQKLRDRIEHLKTADARLLLPIIMAREQSKAEAASTEPAAGAAHSPAASLAEPGSSTPRGTSPHSAESSSSSSAKLEQLRSELLAEAHETLARYDALLPAEPSSLSGASELRKRLHHDEDSDSDGALSPSSRAPTAVAGRRRGTPAAASPLGSAPAAPTPAPVVGQRRLRLSLGPPRTPASSDGAQSSSEPRRRSAFVPPMESPKPQRRITAPAGSPGSPETVHVECRAENPNIHARTSGGRFAPKSAIGTVVPPRSTPTKQPSTAEAKRSARVSAASAGDSPSSSTRPARAARRSAVDLREQYVSETSSEEEQADVKPREAPGPSSRAERAARPRDVSRASEPSMSAVLHQQRQAANKTGPSLAELDASTRRPKRVKLTFARGGRSSASAADDQERGSSASSAGVGVAPAPAPLAAGALLPARILPALASATAAAVESADSSDVEMEVAPSFGASALTLEQAQALMEAAMADTSSAVASPVHRPDGENGTAIAEGVKSEASPSLPLAAPEAVPLPSAPAAVDPTHHATTNAVEATDAEMSDAVELNGEHAAPPPAAAPQAADASASAPAARTSSRVKAASAFGEKIPEQASRREDFDVTWRTQLESADWLPDAAMDEASASASHAQDSHPPAHLNGAVKLEQHDDAAPSGYAEHVPPTS